MRMNEKKIDMTMTELKIESDYYHLILAFYSKSSLKITFQLTKSCKSEQMNE